MTLGFGFGFPRVQVSGLGPSLNLDFAGTAALPSTVTFTRGTNATFTNSAGSVQLTAGINDPRFDYDPITLACKGLLIEEARTNSNRNSTCTGAVAGVPGTSPTFWSVSPAGSGVDREIIGSGTETGIAYVDVRFYGTATASSNSAITTETTTNVTASAGQTWAGSTYVKLVGGSLADVVVSNRVNGRSLVGALLESVGTITITPTSAALNAQRAVSVGTLANALSVFVTHQVVVAYNSGAAIDITLRIGLPQLELGAFATSVIPTTTAAATRNADVALMTGTNFSDWYNQSKGTLYVEFSIPASTASRSQATFGDGTSSERMLISNNTSLTGTVWRIVDGGVDQAGINNSTSFANNATVKAAGAYAANDFATCQGGGTVGTDTSGTLPTVTALYLGSNGVAQYASSYLRRLTYYPTRLPNATLQALTA